MRAFKLTTGDAKSKVYGARPDWRWRIAGGAATLAAVLLLGYVIAYWGWHWLGPRPAPFVPAPLPEPYAAAIASAPLFGRTETAATPSANAPATLQGDVRLLGVFAGADGSGQALFRLAERGPVLVSAGDDLATDVTLLEVRPDGVRIRDHGDTRVLKLRGNAPTVRAAAAAAPRSTIAACARPAGYSGPVYRINAELLTGIAARPEGWTVLLAPVPGGLAVREGTPGAAMLGMKPGDRMTQANGIALRGVEDLQTAFVAPLVASQSVHVVGVHDGKPAAWLFVNAGACHGQ